MWTCRRLGRHLADALAVHRDRMKRLEHGSLGMGLLAKLRAPLVLIDEQRRLQHVNPAAQALLMNDGAVLESGGRLYCRRSFEDNALLVGLRRVLLQYRSHPGESSADKLFLRATTTSGDKTLGLYLYALHPQNTLHAFGDQSLAMILFHERGEQLELDPFVVAAAFDLTPGEARVAVATAHGASPDQIASQYAVSVHTVRSQLRAIFGKTGTSRQSELVSQLAALPMAALGLGDG
jgi:DNA-binding CsgD family transcriptional regulator